MRCSVRRLATNVSPLHSPRNSYYVPEELRDIYLSRILPLATAVTPNVFETQVLCGAAQPPTTTEQALDACRTLHARGPEIVVLTGIPIANAETSPIGDAAAPTLSAVVSFRPRGADATYEEVYQVVLPRLPGALSGCGDLFAALLTPGIFRTMQMGSSAERGACLAACVAQAARTMTQVVADTLRHGEVELRILAARDAFIRHSDVVRDTVANYLLRHAPRDEHYAVRAVHGVHDELLQLVQRVSLRRLRHRQAAGNPATSLASFHVSRHTSLPTAPIGALPLQPLGVIFDMDGTLTLPGAIDFAAMRRELTAMHPPLPPHSTMDLVAYLNGLGDSAEQTALYDVVRRYELAACEAQALRPHLHELLLLLRRHCHIPLALSTRNCREATDIFLYQRYDLPSDVFDFVQVRNTVAVDGQWVNKPHPSVAEDVLRRWQTLPAAGADGGHDDEAENRRRVVFVGDSMDDMKCGRGAGCTTVLIRTHENEHYLRSADCVAHIDFVVSDLNDLALLLVGRPLHAH